MSAILKKRASFFPKNSHFFQKGGLFSPYLTAPNRQYSRALLVRLSSLDPGPWSGFFKLIFIIELSLFQCNYIDITNSHRYHLGMCVSIL